MCNFLKNVYLYTCFFENVDLYVRFLEKRDLNAWGSAKSGPHFEKYGPLCVIISKKGDLDLRNVVLYT